MKINRYSNDAVCAVEKCERYPISKWLCSLHYGRLLKTGTTDDSKVKCNYPENATCTIEKCEKRPFSKWLCSLHYGRLKKTGTTDDPVIKPTNRTIYKYPEASHCIVEGCVNPPKALWMCKTHWARMKRSGSTEQTRGIQPNVYRQTTFNGKRKAVHRVVMEQSIGRELVPGETVHHINGVRDDNHIRNLELWSTSQPAGQRVKDKIKWAKDILALYGEEESQWDVQDQGLVKSGI